MKWKILICIMMLMSISMFSGCIDEQTSKNKTDDIFISQQKLFLGDDWLIEDTQGKHIKFYENYSIRICYYDNGIPYNCSWGSYSIGNGHLVNALEVISNVFICRGTYYFVEDNSFFYLYNVSVKWDNWGEQIDFIRL